MVICNSFRREARLYVVHHSTLSRKLLTRFKNVTEIIMASDRAEKKLLEYNGLKLEGLHDEKMSRSTILTLTSGNY